MYNITLHLYFYLFLFYTSIDEEDVRIVSVNTFFDPIPFNILGNSMYLKST